MKIPRHAVRGVYRCIVRHLTHLDPSLIKKVRKQFNRRPNYAKIGHIRAAYNLEAQLRACALGEISLEQVKSNFTKHAPKNKIEKNAQAMHQLWASRQERRYDQYNAPPLKGTLEYARVHMAAGLNNLRHRILHRNNWNLQDCDTAVIDTVLGPSLREIKEKQRLKRHLQRTSTPRQVRFKAFLREGVAMYTQRIQGLKISSRGIAGILNQANKNRDRFEKMRALQLSLKDSKSKEDLARIKREIVKINDKVRRLQDYSRVQRQIQLKRAEQAQRKWNYTFRLKKQNVLPKKKVAKTLATL